MGTFEKWVGTDPTYAVIFNGTVSENFLIIILYFIQSQVLLTRSSLVILSINRGIFVNNIFLINISNSVSD